MNNVVSRMDFDSRIVEYRDGDISLFWFDESRKLTVTLTPEGPVVVYLDKYEENIKLEDFQEFDNAYEAMQVARKLWYGTNGMVVE